MGASAFIRSALLVRDFRRLNDFPLDVPRSGVLVDAQNGPVVRDLLEHVERTVPPAAPLPVYPLQPMIGFLAWREPVVGFHVIWPVQGAARDDRIIAGFERERPPMVVYGSRSTRTSAGSSRTRRGSSRISLSTTRSTTSSRARRSVRSCSR
jgi:hypothetical protein